MHDFFHEWSEAHFVDPSSRTPCFRMRQCVYGRNSNAFVDKTKGHSKSKSFDTHHLSLLSGYLTFLAGKSTMNVEVFPIQNRVVPQLCELTVVILAIRLEGS